LQQEGLISYHSPLGLNEPNPFTHCPNQVYIVGHMPPGVDERHLGTQHNQLTFTERNNQRYLDMVRRFAPVIQGQFFGHLHSDTFRLIYDAKG